MLYNILGLCGFLTATVLVVNADVGSTSLTGNSFRGGGLIGSSDGVIQGGIPTGVGQGMGARRLGGLQGGMGLGDTGNSARRFDSPIGSMYTNQALGRGFGGGALLGGQNLLDRGGHVNVLGTRGAFGLHRGFKRRR